MRKREHEMGDDTISKAFGIVFSMGGGWRLEAVGAANYRQLLAAGVRTLQKWCE